MAVHQLWSRRNIHAQFPHSVCETTAAVYVTRCHCGLQGCQVEWMVCANLLHGWLQKPEVAKAQHQRMVCKIKAVALLSSLTWLGYQ